MAMTRDTRTGAQRNRAIRQDELREQLAAQGHLQHVVDLSNKLIDADNEMDNAMVNRTKIAIDAKLKIIDKYLPSLKSVELSGNEDAPVAVTTIQLVPLSDDSTG